MIIRLSFIKTMISESRYATTRADTNRMTTSSQETGGGSTHVSLERTLRRT